jgi:hypothetical protein
MFDLWRREDQFEAPAGRRGGQSGASTRDAGRQTRQQCKCPKQGHGQGIESI